MGNRYINNNDKTAKKTRRRVKTSGKKRGSETEKNAIEERSLAVEFRDWPRPRRFKREGKLGRFRNVKNVEKTRRNGRKRELKEKMTEESQVFVGL